MLYQQDERNTVEAYLQESLSLSEEDISTKELLARALQGADAITREIQFRDFRSSGSLDVVAHAAAKCPTLEKVSFCGCVLESTTPIAHIIRSNPCVTDVSITYCTVSEDGYTEIALALEFLEDPLQSITVSTVEALLSLLHIKSRKFTFCYNNIYPCNYIDEYEMSCIVEIIKDNHAIQNLVFQKCELEKKAYQKLARLFLESKTLKTFELEDQNSTSSEGIKILTSALASNSTLECATMEVTLDEKVMGHFAEMLKINKTIRHLEVKGTGHDLSRGYCKIELDSLSQVLQHQNTSLTALTLRDMHLSRRHFKAIAKFLRANPPLQSLTLENANVGNSSVKLLAEGLKRNSNLLSLALPRNRISSIGISALTQSLKVNTGLTKLDVGHCICRSGIEIFLMKNGMVFNVALNDLICDEFPDRNLRAFMKRKRRRTMGGYEHGGGGGAGGRVSTMWSPDMVYMG